MRILFLHAEVMGYTLASIMELAKSDANRVLVVHDDRRTYTFVNKVHKYNIKFLKKNNLPFDTLLDHCNAFDPDIVVTSGWMYLDYLRLAALFRKSGKKTVLGLDGQWFGTAKQCLGSMVSNLGIRNKFYSHAWVAGLPQYEFARRLGFQKKQIIIDLYSADLKLFMQYQIGLKAFSRGHVNFLFVGRLVEEKGLLVLLQAWESFVLEDNFCTLQVVGPGDLPARFRNLPRLFIHGQKEPDEIIKIASRCQCFVLPSIYEPWGVVVHEFAAMGMPLILSDKVGAGSAFLINNANGIKVKNKSVEELKAALETFSKYNGKRFKEMSSLSSSLAKRISPETSAKQLLSID